jgi:site-specific DNA-methyltransferase (adenine-specific)
MKPYFDDGQCVIYHGDAREIIASLNADRIITDPVWPNADARLQGAADPQRLLSETLAAASAKTIVLQLGRASDPRFLAAVPSSWPFLCVRWLRYAVPSYNGRVLTDADVAYAFGVAVPSAPGRRVIPGVTLSVRGEMPRGHGRNRSAAQYAATQDALPHPAARHLRHLLWLVNWFSDPGETVLDPFCGTGTTLRACKDSGRRAIGIEIEERYCEIAAGRLAQQVLPLHEAGV